MSDSTSNCSSGRALRYRRMPARRGDCTSVRNRASSLELDDAGGGDEHLRGEQVGARAQSAGAKDVARGERKALPPDDPDEKDQKSNSSNEKREPDVVVRHEQDGKLFLPLRRPTP